MGKLKQVEYIEFCGTVITVLRSKDIYVMISSICDNLHMTEYQKDKQLDVFTEDVFNNATISCHVYINGKIEQKNFINVKYLSLWLSKIALNKHQMELYGDLLLEYQLSLRDHIVDYYNNNVTDVVLSDEQVNKIANQMLEMQSNFFNDFNQSFSNMARMIIDQGEKIQNITTTTALLSDKVNDIQNSSVKITRMRSKKSNDNVNTNALVDNSYGKRTYNKRSASERNYRKQIKEMCDEVVSRTEYKASYQVLGVIYKIMTTKYGICWDQERTDYKNANDLDSMPDLLTVIYYSSNDKHIKSIFESILFDMVENTKENNLKYDNVDLISWNQAENLVKKIAEHNADYSPYQAVTYRKLYKLMDENNDINWKYFKSSYMKKHNKVKAGENITNKMIIESSSKLKKIFTATSIDYAKSLEII